MTNELINACMMLAQIHALDGRRCEYWCVDMLDLAEPFTPKNHRAGFFDFNEEIKPKLPENGFVLDLKSNGFLLTLSRLNTKKNIMEFWTFAI